MIDTKTDVPQKTTDPITNEIILELIKTPGPCITVILPPYRPGEQGKPAAALLKMDLQELRKKLEGWKIMQPGIAELLEPIEELSLEKASAAGREYGRAILRSPAIFRQFDLLTSRLQDHTNSAGECFNIRPLLASLFLPPTIYVLDITKDAVSLFDCELLQVNRVELPKDTPATLGEALELDQPDHDLMNRSSAGPSIGTMQGVQFGTGSARERRRNHLHDFYRVVDRGVNEVLRSRHAPLILLGVDEDVQIYRAVNAYPNLIEKAIPPGTGAPISHAQVLRQAHDVVVFDAERRAGAQMREAKERLSPGRFSTDLNTILRATVEGRVAQLYMDENANRVGAFDGKIYGGKTNWHNEDLLNVAAVETLARSGEVYSLPTHQMDGALVAAALRY